MMMKMTSLSESAARTTAKHIREIGYTSLQGLPSILLFIIAPYLEPFDMYQLYDVMTTRGVDTEDYWKHRTMQRWPKKHSYNSQWFHKGLQYVDLAVDDTEYWRKKYLQGHVIDTLRALVYSKTNIDPEFLLRKLFASPFSVEMNGRNIKLLTISDESLIRNQIPQELDYLLIRDGKLFQYFNEFTEIQNILKIHIKRLTIFHCVSNTDSLLKVIQNLIQYGSLEAIELIDSNLDGDNVMKLIQLCQYKQLEKRCSCQGNREDDADLYDVALVGAMNSDKGCCHDNGPASLDDIVLEQSRGVTSLLLENMRISDYVARSLGNQLKNWKNLKKFSLRSCIFSDNNCSTAILQGLIDSCYLGGLKHLEISDLAFLPKDHVVSLLKSLIRCKNCCLQILILEYIGWTSYSSTAFPGFFSRQSFSDVPRQFELTQYINLSGINFQCSSDVWCLCYLIHCDTALRYLTLGDCHLLPIHLNQIFQTVRESRLETLDVSGNRYDEDENDALSELLRNGGLRRLNLNACHIHGILSTKLIKALQANTKLKMLWIAENRLGDEGLAMLAGIFEKPDSRSALEVLDISRNCISKEGFLRFATLLQPSKESIKLQEIVVYGNWLKEDKENIKTVEKTLGEIIPTVRISTMYQATRDSFKAEHVSQM